LVSAVSCAEEIVVRNIAVMTNRLFNFICNLF
jgi:hypothetical protein